MYINAKKRIPVKTGTQVSNVDIIKKQIHTAAKELSSHTDKNEQLKIDNKTLTEQNNDLKIQIKLREGSIEKLDIQIDTRHEEFKRQLLSTDDTLKSVKSDIQLFEIKRSNLETEILQKERLVIGKDLLEGEIEKQKLIIKDLQKEKESLQDTIKIKSTELDSRVKAALKKEQEVQEMVNRNGRILTSIETAKAYIQVYAIRLQKYYDYAKLNINILEHLDIHLTKE